MVDYAADVMGEFRDEIEDALHEFEVRISNLTSNPKTVTSECRRLAQDVHMLRLKARAVDEVMMETILHRLHDYVRGLDAADEAQLSDLQNFFDVMRGVLNGSVDTSEKAIPEMVRSLPSRTVADLDDILALEVEVMVVVPQRSLLHWLERELKACGFRVFGAQGSFEAFESAVRTKPDMIIVSGQIDQLSGVDLACAFRAMPATRDIPVCLLTGSSKVSKDLPDDVPVLNKSKDFGEELAAALSVMGIT